MIHSLTGKDGMGLGGFRIEVTVRAVSLREATKVVKRTGFLNPEYWLGLGDGPHAPTPHQRQGGRAGRPSWRTPTGCFNKPNLGQSLPWSGGHKPSKQHIQALTDILNALGWNGGPAHSDKVTASQRLVEHGGTCCPDSLRHAGEIYQTDDQIRALFELARANSCRDGLPCKSQPNDPSHRYQVNNGRPFRIRCCMHGCYHRLQRAAIIHWIAELVNHGVIDGANLGLDDGT